MQEKTTKKKQHTGIRLLIGGLIFEILFFRMKEKEGRGRSMLLFYLGVIM